LRFVIVQSAKALVIGGYIPCVLCGKGDECERSGIKKRVAPGTRTRAVKYAITKDQKDVWKEAMRMDRPLGERLK
jgi:hypothetical protein